MLPANCFRLYLLEICTFNHQLSSSSTHSNCLVFSTSYKAFKPDSHHCMMRNLVYNPSLFNLLLMGTFATVLRSCSHSSQIFLGLFPAYFFLLLFLLLSCHLPRAIHAMIIYSTISVPSIYGIVALHRRAGILTVSLSESAGLVIGGNDSETVKRVVNFGRCERDGRLSHRFRLSVIFSPLPAIVLYDRIPCILAGRLLHISRHELFTA